MCLRSRRIQRALRPLILTLALLGCREHDRPKPELATVPAGDEAPKIELLEAGVEPRVSRAPAFAIGRFETRVSVISMNTVAQVGRAAKTYPAGVTTIDIAVAIDRAAPVQGTATVARIEMQSVDRAAKPEPAVEGLVGASWRFVIGGRGEVVTLSAPVVTGERATFLREDVANAVRGLFVPVPHEPTGIGAKWRVTTTLRPPTGGTRTEIVTYELVGERAGTLELRANGTGTAEGPGVTAESTSNGTVLTATPWRPAQTALMKDARIEVTQNGPTVTIDQEGRQESAPAGTEIPTLRATCEQARACCHALDSELSPDQRGDCANAVASQDTTACSKQFSTLQRAVLLLGKARVTACR